jgi:alpha-tubulin suppressor-like RCC1 family protein
VFSFGYDAFGCLGHEDRQEDDPAQITPREIEALRGVDVASVSIAQWHVLALTYEGEVYQWGSLFPELQVGYGDPPPVEGVRLGRRPRPRRIEALRGVQIRGVAAGCTYACVVTHSGAIFTWGNGEEGCLGHGGFANEPLPNCVAQFEHDGIIVVGVCAGLNNTLAVGNDGRTYGVGLLRATGAAILEELDEESDSEDEDDPLHLNRYTARWLPVGDADFKVLVPRSVSGE